MCDCVCEKKRSKNKCFNMGISQSFIDIAYNMFVRFWVIADTQKVSNDSFSRTVVDNNGRCHSMDLSK